MNADAGPDLSLTAAFLDVVFRYADPDSFVALRCFPQHDKGKPAAWLVDVRAGDQDRLVAEIGRGIHRAAMATEPEVFSPVTAATFTKPGTAKTRDIANGLAIAVEIDSGDTAAARARLEAILGPATLVVRSGGEWIDPETGEIHPKLHVYWRLSKPTTDEAGHMLLHSARRHAAILAGADMSGTPVAHCFRFPGSLNRKDPDRPARCTVDRLNGDAEVHLIEAAERLAEAVEGAGLNGDGRHKGNGAGKGNGAYQGKRELQADPGLVAAAMATIPNADVHYNEWVRMAYAVAGATGGSGFDTFSAWSAKSSKHDDGETKALWSRVLAAGPTHIGAGSIFYEARQHGWIDPRHGQTPGATASQTPPPTESDTGSGIGGGKPPPPPGRPGTHNGPDDTNKDTALPPKFSENALAHLFTARHATSLVHVHQWGRWLHFNGHRWQEDHAVNVFDKARMICAEQGAIATTVLNRSGAKVAAAINKAAAVAAIERLARHHHKHVRQADEFDTDQWLLNGPTRAQNMQKD